MKLDMRSGYSRLILRTAVAALAGLAVWAVLSGVLEKRMRDEQRAIYHSDLALLGGNLSLIFNTRLALANSLEAFVHTTYDSPDLRTKDRKSVV